MSLFSLKKVIFLCWCCILCWNVLNMIIYFSVYADKMRSCGMDLFVFSYVRGRNMAALLLSPHPVAY